MKRKIAILCLGIIIVFLLGFTYDMGRKQDSSLYLIDDFENDLDTDESKEAYLYEFLREHDIEMSDDSQVDYVREVNGDEAVMYRIHEGD